MKGGLVLFTFQYQLQSWYGAWRRAVVMDWGRGTAQGSVRVRRQGSMQPSVHAQKERVGW